MKVTDLNVWSLARHFDGRTETPNGTVRPTSARHLRRCMKAGLLTADKSTLRLTAKGIAAIEAAGYGGSR